MQTVRDFWDKARGIPSAKGPTVDMEAMAAAEETKLKAKLAAAARETREPLRDMIQDSKQASPEAIAEVLAQVEKAEAERAAQLTAKQAREETTVEQANREIGKAKWEGPEQGGSGEAKIDMN